MAVGRQGGASVDVGLTNWWPLASSHETLARSSRELCRQMGRRTDRQEGLACPRRRAHTNFQRRPGNRSKQTRTNYVMSDSLRAPLIVFARVCNPLARRSNMASPTRVLLQSWTRQPPTLVHALSSRRRTSASNSATCCASRRRRREDALGRLTSAGANHITKVSARAGELNRSLPQPVRAGPE